MTDTAIDWAEEAILNEDISISDESLESAAIVAESGARSIGFFCTGLNECPA
ncbi:MAG: hypothetical protein P8Y53_13335 [Pseudolabrys sp.]|jgi:hypothetical protein